MGRTRLRERTMTRQLIAILAADVAGYSRLMGADEDGTLTALTAHLRELIDPAVAQHAGRIVKTTGDGLLVEFASVVDAVRCAVDIQRGMAARNRAVPQDRRLAFRIGLNLGDVIVQNGDLYGDGVNVAARLEALAEPGGICLSASAHEQVQDKIATVRFEDLGEQRMKNIARPVRAYRIALDLAGPVLSPVPAPPGWSSIAVLPLDN
jgi:adenylate cyclase